MLTDDGNDKRERHAGRTVGKVLDGTPRGPTLDLVAWLQPQTFEEITMKRNRLLLQALAVTVMGFVAHLTAPAPVSSTAGSACGWDRCTGVCGVANPCDSECGWICKSPPNDECGLTQWYEACPIPT